VGLDIVGYMKSKGFRIKYIGGVVRTFCPFPEHKETKPSFTLYPHDNSYHCFGCKEHGSILNLMRLFGDAVSPELMDEEKRVRALTDVKSNPLLKDKIRRATGILLRIRRMRKWYKNHRKLNRIMYAILEIYKGVTLENPTRKRFSRSAKR
jgi:DNA primase